MVKTERIRKLNDCISQGGPVVYWMSRDQRTEDNWALLYAQQLAQEKRVALIVVFNLVPHFLAPAARQYVFKVRGLQELSGYLARKRIPFFLRLDERGIYTPAGQVGMQYNVMYRTPQVRISGTSASGTPTVLPR